MVVHFHKNVEINSMLQKPENENWIRLSFMKQSKLPFNLRSVDIWISIESIETLTGNSCGFQNTRLKTKL